MKTFSTKPSDVQSLWHVFDATGKTLGRLATEVAVLLQGKHKPTYARHLLTGDYVIVVNASKIKVTGDKLQQKLYRRHSNYPGGLKETTLFKLQSKYPDRVLRHAVRGMLPKNTLGDHMLRRLKVYSGESHPHESQVKSSASMEAQSHIQELPAVPASPPHMESREMEQSPETLAEETPDKKVEE